MFGHMINRIAAADIGALPRPSHVHDAAASAMLYPRVIVATAALVR